MPTPVGTTPPSSEPQQSVPTGRKIDLPPEPPSEITNTTPPVQLHPDRWDSASHGARILAAVGCTIGTGIAVLVDPTPERAAEFCAAGSGAGAAFGTVLGYLVNPLFPPHEPPKPPKPPTYA